jgi:hypothetical protein
MFNDITEAFTFGWEKGVAMNIEYEEDEDAED